MQKTKLVGRVVTLKPGSHITDSKETSLLYYPKASVFIEDERIVDVTTDTCNNTPDWETEDHSQKLLLPGFIDLHCHFPQLDMIGCYGEELLGWLQQYTFPEETRFADRQHAETAANAFFNILANHGTTTAMVFSSSHQLATDALFKAAKKTGLRLYGGMTAMDRNAPECLVSTPEKILQTTRELINSHHRPAQGIHYCLTPRFAPATSEDLLAGCATLCREHQDVHLQTHYAESKAELAWVKKLFPGDESYLDVYLRHGLIDQRSILAHGIHVSDVDLDRLAAHGAKVAHCPSSNLFLGSGLFPMKRYLAKGVQFGLATDIGAGTNFSMWHVMATAYQVQKIQGETLSPEQLFYLATLGGANCLNRGHELGCLAAGYKADIQIIDPSRHSLTERRFSEQLDAREILFALTHLADDRLTDSVFINGRKCLIEPLTQIHGELHPCSLPQ